MNPMFRLSCCCIALSLAACGGQNHDPMAAGSSTRLAAVLQAAPAETTLAGNRSQYVIAASNGSFLVTDIATSQAATYAAGTRLRLADGGVAFDLDGAAGQAFRLYQAAFNRQPDAAGLGFYIAALDSSGLSLDMIAQSFIDSQEFSSLYGNLNNAQYLTVLYNNVLKRIPDQAGFDYNLSFLDGSNPAGTVVTRAQMLRFFSESDENKALVEPAIHNGIDYLPWGMAAPNTPVASFAGTYSGNFGGSDAGPLTIVPDASGNITLTAHANTANIDLSGSGTLQVGGKFSGTLSGGGRSMNVAGSINLNLGYTTGTWSFSGAAGSGVFIAIKPVQQGPQFSQVRAIIQQRCVPCHSAAPTMPGFPSAPLGITFDTEAQIRARADQIRSVAVDSQFMPYNNMTGMTPAERDYLRSWFDAGKP